MLTAIHRIWKAVEWRLTPLYTQIVNALNRIWNGVAWRVWPIVLEIYLQVLYQLAYLHRRSLGQTAFVGVTGSVGKTTAKELIASILERHLHKGQKGSGTLNGPYDVARLVLRTRASDAYCVTEIAITTVLGLDPPLALFRPTVGVVTTVGSDHSSAYGGLDGLANEKSKLIKSLPADGIAILNADDPRVLAMQSQFSGRTVTYGMSNDATLRGEAVESSWPDRLSFTVKWNGQSVRVQTQLCGSHWVPVVLAALATGVALRIPLDVAAAAVATAEPFEGRMSPVKLGDGVTFMRDDWKAPFWTIAPTFDFMRQARAARKIIVIGTLSDYSGDSTRRYVEIARQALSVADCVVFVGHRGSACLRAKRDPQDQLFAFPSLRDASTYLSGYLRPGDLVLLKGSARTDHLERLILARAGGVECWLSGCGRAYFCTACSLVHVPSAPERAGTAAAADFGVREPDAAAVASSAGDRLMTVLVGLGNPGERYTGTPHNVGYSVMDILAERLTGNWTRQGDLAMVVRTHWKGQAICLVKLLTSMNSVGPPLARLAQELGCSVQECIIVHDDLDLPIGTIRARNRGGDGGHLGVRSILQTFQEDKFRRVKIGVGKPRAGQAIDDYVLSPFSPDELAAVDAANRAAADRVIELMRQQSTSSSSLTREETA